jgi:large subunit ribosomal protein L21
MYAVIQTGGQQFKVAAGDKLKVDKLSAEVGSEVTLDKVLLVKTDSETKIGSPFVEGAKVVGKVLEQDRYKKILVFKFKRRKGYKKTHGHRQHYTLIQIEKIEG